MKGTATYYNGQYVGQLDEIVHGRAHVIPDPQLTVDQLHQLVVQFEGSQLTFHPVPALSARAHRSNGPVHSVVVQLGHRT